MKYFQPIPIEHFLRLILNDDREIMLMMESWNIEREEVHTILLKHFNELGIFMVNPLDHAELIYKNIITGLKYSPELRHRISKIQEEIERTKSKHTRHNR